MWFRNSFTAFFVSLCIFAFPNFSSAQSRVNNSGNGGLHTIQGRIYSSNNKTLDTSISVRLESMTFGALSLVTDQNGGFAFTSLQPGSYTVVVNAGDNFEVARESVTIDPQIQGTVPMRDQPRLFNIPVYLQLKRNAGQKTGLVNAKLSDVPKDALKHYEKGVGLNQDGKAEDAVMEFRQAISIYPGLTQAHIEIGKIYLKLGRFDDAIASLRMALRLDPKDFDAHLNLGIVLLNSKKYDEAEPEFVTAAYLNRFAVTPHYYLGLIYVEKHDLDIAQKALEKAKELAGSSSFPLLHKYLGGVYLAKNLNKLAVAELETYISMVPNAKDADRIRQTIADLRSKIN